MSIKKTEPKLNFSKLQEGQAGAEETVNDSLDRYDALYQLPVISETTTTPPSSPTAGDLYIVETGATGLWSGHDDELAFWDGAYWIFFTPREGWVTWVKDTNLLCVWTTAGGGLKEVCYEGSPACGVYREEPLNVVDIAQYSQVDGTPNIVTHTFPSASAHKVKFMAFDKTSVETRTGIWHMPEEWDKGTVKARFLWKANSPSSGGVAWTIKGQVYRHDDDMDSFTPTAQTIVDNAVHDEHDLWISDPTPAITIAGTFNVDKTVIFQFGRNPAHGSDNLSADAYLAAVLIQYKINPTVNLFWG